MCYKRKPLTTKCEQFCKIIIHNYAMIPYIDIVVFEGKVSTLHKCLRKARK